MDDKLVERVAKAIFETTPYASVRWDTVSGDELGETMRKAAQAAITALTTTADAFKPCEICDDPALCASGKTPCYLCGEFVAPVPADVANKLLNTRTTTADDALRDDAEWCAPGDDQQDRWLVRFNDTDMREAIYSGPNAEKEAREKWNAMCGPSGTWNGYLFRLASRLCSPSPDGEVTEEMIEAGLDALFTYKWSSNPEQDREMLAAIFKAMISARSGG